MLCTSDDDDDALQEHIVSGVDPQDPSDASSLHSRVAYIRVRASDL